MGPVFTGHPQALNDVGIIKTRKENNQGLATDHVKVNVDQFELGSDQFKVGGDRFKVDADHFKVDEAHIELDGNHFEMDDDYRSVVITRPWSLATDHRTPATLEQSVVERFNFKNNQGLEREAGGEGRSWLL